MVSRNHIPLSSKTRKLSKLNKNREAVILTAINFQINTPISNRANTTANPIKVFLVETFISISSPPIFPHNFLNRMFPILWRPSFHILCMMNPIYFDGLQLLYPPAKNQPFSTLSFYFFRHKTPSSNHSEEGKNACSAADAVYWHFTERDAAISPAPRST